MPGESDSQCQGLDKKIVDLINQYKELRERRRHLPDGAYDKDLRDHAGKLHRVLQSLGTELGHPPYTRKIIVGCLGEPDAIRNNVQMARYLGIYERERGKRGESQGRNEIGNIWSITGGEDTTSCSSLMKAG